MTSEEEQTPCRDVAFLFFGAYFSPLVFWIGMCLLSDNPGTGCFMALMFIYFPSGLFGFISDSTNIAGLAVLGYTVYGVLFFLAFKLRRYWQTILLWMVLVSLMVLNVAGCGPVTEHVTAGMSLP